MRLDFIICYSSNNFYFDNSVHLMHLLNKNKLEKHFPKLTLFPTTHRLGLKSPTADDLWGNI